MEVETVTRNRWRRWRKPAVVIVVAILFAGAIALRSYQDRRNVGVAVTDRTTLKYDYEDIHQTGGDGWVVGTNDFTPVGIEISRGGAPTDYTHVELIGASGQTAIGKGRAAPDRKPKWFIVTTTALRTPTVDRLEFETEAEWRAALNARGLQSVNLMTPEEFDKQAR